MTFLRFLLLSVRPSVDTRNASREDRKGRKGGKGLEQQSPGWFSKSFCSAPRILSFFVFQLDELPPGVNEAARLEYQG
jgi:hypothetical protein